MAQQFLLTLIKTIKVEIHIRKTALEILREMEDPQNQPY